MPSVASNIGRLLNFYGKLRKTEQSGDMFLSLTSERGGRVPFWKISNIGRLLMESLQIDTSQNQNISSFLFLIKSDAYITHNAPRLQTVQTEIQVCYESSS